MHTRLFCKFVLHKYQKVYFMHLTLVMYYDMSIVCFHSHLMQFIRIMSFAKNMHIITYFLYNMQMNSLQIYRDHRKIIIDSTNNRNKDSQNIHW